MNESPGAGTIRLVVKGIGNCPSFKNRKRAILDSNTGKMRTLTEPKAKQWMEKCIQSLSSQLLAYSQTTEGGTLTDAQRQCLTALLRQSDQFDDSWQWIPEIDIRSRLVEQGQEGAEVEIEYL